MPRILLTNDDGIMAQGILSALQHLREIAEVWTVAPDREMSAVSHALTLAHPLRLTHLGENKYAVDGTPADCVNLGLLHIMREARPDLVVSGINFGVNLGDDVTYSGTVSAAFEAHILGVPAIAISQEVGEGLDFGAAARFTTQLVAHLLADPALDRKTLLNINVPLTTPRGIRVCRLGKRIYGDVVIEKEDPRGRKYYWIGPAPPRGVSEEGTDMYALAAGDISITPLSLDLTDYEGLAKASALESALGEFAPA